MGDTKTRTRMNLQAILRTPGHSHKGPANEPVWEYQPGSKEKQSLLEKIRSMKEMDWDLPMIIGGEEVFTDQKVDLRPPHELQHKLGVFNKGTAQHVDQAIGAAMNAHQKWAVMPWQDRASIFLKAADLISGPKRDVMNASTMLGQSKTVYQSEIDAVCELADFLRFNVYYMTQILSDQPNSPAGVWNQMDYRPLEGFVFAITPFNFTAIAGNLPSAPALMGNTVVWKPAESQIFAAHFVMEVFREAGLPDGVINLIYTDGPEAGDRVFAHPDFAGLHFTGSSQVFKTLWKTISDNLDSYKSYPRIVGETGGKDFVLVHPTSDPMEVATALTRGAFEFQGQKCSAASRAYIPRSMWEEVQEGLMGQIRSIKMGSVEDFYNFMTAVIDEKAFDKISGYIQFARDAAEAEIIIGGSCDKSEGYFIEPTVIVTTDPQFKTMKEEIFGPVLTIYVYEDDRFEEVVDLVDQTSPYGLTGSIFARDRGVVDMVNERLRYAAGNFYINDKPTGAVVGQQPFGGARASGTNDKAGSILNLFRWVSPRTIKENFHPPSDYRYPFMGE